MAKEDIYNSKKKYESFMARLKSLTDNPIGKRKYQCKNKSNLEYYRRMHGIFEATDKSYVRRMRLFGSLNFIVHHIQKDLRLCDREDINNIVAAMYQAFNSPKSQSDFIKDLRHLWRQLFPELDAQGRPDETLCPYVVRHLKAKQDKSKETGRQDKLTVQEVEKLLNYFSEDTRMQAYIALLYFNFGRPQELLWVRLRDVEDLETCAKVYINEHGKEGTKFLSCFDSYPYLVAWLQKHPFRHDPNEFLFINYCNNCKTRQLNVAGANKRIRQACEALRINKRITSYSFKRNGITHEFLAGTSPADIKLKAGWNSVKQLQTYDLTDQHDYHNKELERRQGGVRKPLRLEIKKCAFCHTENIPTATHCKTCQRVLNRDELKLNLLDAFMKEPAIQDLLRLKEKVMALEAIT